MSKREMEILKERKKKTSPRRTDSGDTGTSPLAGCYILDKLDVSDKSQPVNAKRFSGLDKADSSGRHVVTRRSDAVRLCGATVDR